MHINNLGNDKFLFYIDDNCIKKTSFKESFLVNFGNNFCNICKSKQKDVNYNMYSIITVACSVKYFIILIFVIY